MRLELAPVLPTVRVSVELMAVRFAETKASGLSWDGDNSGPDATLRFVAPTGEQRSLYGRNDVWSWEGSFPVGDFELSQASAIQITGTDRDFIEDDFLGAVTVSSEELSTGGELRTGLMHNGTQTAELVFRVTPRVVP